MEKKVKDFAGISKGLYEENYVEKLRQSPHYLEELLKAVKELEALKTDKEFIAGLEKVVDNLKKLKDELE